jgi:hypothetical protein
MRMRSSLIVFSILFIGLGACSDDTDSSGGAQECAPGERFNTLNGECVPERSAGNNNGTDAGDTTGDADPNQDVWVPPDSSYNPDSGTSVDVDPDDACENSIDSDGDGLTNGCECRLNTSPSHTDTDRDGVPDGEEDANKNCRFDSGESDPRTSDTDGDGLDDGQERVNGTDFLNPDSDDDGILDGAEVDSGCMNPRSEDTDGDGIPDGVEDGNGDGQIGTCANRQYAVSCAQGESDPCSTDTNGDGTPDNEEVQYLECRPADTQNLTQPQLVSSSAGNYQLAVTAGVGVGQVSGLSSGNAHAFDDTAQKYAGFVASLSTSASSAEAVRDDVYSQVAGIYGGSSQRASGRRISSHDGYTAVVNSIVDLSGVQAPATARDAILGQLAGGTPSHSLSGSFPAGTASDPLLFVFEVLERGSGGYIISAAVVRESDYTDDTQQTGYLVDDITGGAAVAEASELLTEQCVSYRVDNAAKVDFIWVIDSSGSMDDEIAQVQSFASNFAQILGQSNLDWRIGVTTAACSEIANDPAVSAEISNLFGSSCAPPPIPFPIPIPVPDFSNGKLCDLNGANFTSDPQKFQDCVADVSGQAGSEHTATIGMAAIDRALPRAVNDPLKLRDGAAVVVIGVTDEFDDHFQSEMGWRDAGGAGEPPNDPTTNAGFDAAGLDQVVQPIIDYYLRPQIGATVFGIHWIPGEGCSTASEAAAGLGQVVGATGGTSGSICQSDLSTTLSDIANASAGIASGLRLRGTPAPPSIEVNVGQASTGNIIGWTRSRSDGWDYDSIVNRILFSGPNPPQTGDRAVIPYLRWEGSFQQCTADSDCPQEQKYRCVDGVCQ